MKWFVLKVMKRDVQKIVYRHTPASETCKGMPQAGGTKVVSMSSVGIVRDVFWGSAVDSGAGSRLVL